MHKYTLENGCFGKLIAAKVWPPPFMLHSESVAVYALKISKLPSGNTLAMT